MSKPTKKLTKAQRNAIKKTLKKWSSSDYVDSGKMNKHAATFSAAAVLILIPDFILTGGMASIGLAALNSLTAGVHAAQWLDKQKHQDIKNTLGQKLRATQIVRESLRKMENKLQTQFNIAACHPDDEREAAEAELQALAKEITEDVKTLMPVITIVDLDPEHKGYEKLMLSVRDDKDRPVTTEDIQRPNRPRIKKLPL